MSSSSCMEVYVECAAKDAGGLLSVDIPGRRVFSGSPLPGIDVVVLRPARGQLSVLQQSRFDTYGDPRAEQQLVEFLRALAPGRVVVLGVADSAVKRRGVLAGELLQQALVLLGGVERRGFGPGCLAPLSRLNFREAWAFIGVRGAPAGTAGELKARSRNDALRIDAHILQADKAIPSLTVLQGKCWDVRDGAQILARPVPAVVPSSASAQTARKPAAPVVTISLLDDPAGGNSTSDHQWPADDSRAGSWQEASSSAAADRTAPLSAVKRPRWTISHRWITAPAELWQPSVDHAKI